MKREQVGVFSLATGALLEGAMKAYFGKQTGEHAVLRQVMEVFNANDIVMGDAYYGSFLHERKPREMSFKLALQMVIAYRHAGLLQEENILL